MLCTMHVFSPFIWPFHCIHIAISKAHAACRRPKSFLRRCTTILHHMAATKAHAACPKKPIRATGEYLRILVRCHSPRQHSNGSKATRSKARDAHHTNAVSSEKHALRQKLRSVKDKPFYCQYSVGTILLQEIQSVNNKPFYCQFSVGTILFLLPVFCGDNSVARHPQCQEQAFLLPYGNGSDDDGIS